MRAVLLVVAAITSTTIGFAQAPSVLLRRGSASVRPPAWRELRTAVGSLLGWQVGVPLGSFRQETFFEAAGKADALGVAVVEGNSAQKVSAQIPKNLDYRLASGEMDAVRDRMTTLNVRMPVYVTPAISEDGQIARKTFEFAKSLGVETLAVERSPAALPAIEKLADEFAVNVALGGSAEGLCSRRFRGAAGESGRMPISTSGCRTVGASRRNCASQRQSAGVEAQRSDRSRAAPGRALPAGVETFAHHRMHEQRTECHGRFVAVA